MAITTTTLTLKAAGTTDAAATTRITYEIMESLDATISNQVRALMASDLDLEDGEYDVYDESTRRPGAEFVIASSAGVISARWRAATLAPGQWEGFPAGLRVAERD